MKSLRKFVILLGLLAVPVLVSPVQGQFFFFENPLIGEQAPDFTLKTAQGDEKNLADYRQGRPAIVFFWATWCPHCMEQLHALNAKAAEIKQKGTEVILVDLEESAGQVQSYLEKNSIQLETFLDEKGSVAENYQIMGIPTFFFVDAKGTIQAVEHFLPEDYEELLK